MILISIKGVFFENIAIVSNYSKDELLLKMII